MAKETEPDKNYLEKAEAIFSEIGAAQDLERVRQGLGKPPKEPAGETPETSLKAKRELDFVFEINHAISSILEIDKLLDKILDSAIEISGAERGFLQLYEEGGEHGGLNPVKTIQKQGFSQDEFSISKNIVALVEKTRRPILITDAQTDPRFNNKASIIKYNLRSIICFPLIFKNKFIGLLYLDNRLVTRLFTDQDLLLMTPVAAQAAISIENARAYKKIEELGVLMARTEKLAALGKLGGAISHELQTPLAAIKMAIDRVMTGFETIKKEEEKEYLTIINNRIDDSFRIVRDILSFSRIKMPEFKAVNLDSIILHSLENIPRPENILIEKEFEAPPSRLLVDADQLGQVFNNLILNAFQAMPGGGKLRIISRSNANSVEIDFADSGEGIPSENLPKIFDPLFTTKPEGTGFGLAICQSIIEGHKGKIEVESQIGQGSVFKVTLPRGR